MDTSSTPKYKLIFCGNLASVCGGQNRVALFTIAELVKLGYEVHNVGKGVQVLDEGYELPCKCYPFSEHDPNHFYTLVDAIKPDIILFSHDIWNYYFLPELKNKYPHIPICGWFTVDAHPIHYSWFPILRSTDYICVSTEFGKQTIYQRFPEKGVEVIKYGVDRNIYNLN